MRFRSVRKVFSLVCLLCCLCVVPVYAVSDVVSPDASTVQVVSEPKYAPYIGSGWITGTVADLGEVYVYVPITSSGVWGTTSDGFLCNVGSSSVSGLMFTASGTKYIFSCSSFAVPRYRLSDSSGYQYSDLYLTVTGSNLDIATTFPGSFTFANSWPYIVIGLMGVILVCLMRYKR